jgi:predicted dehydrogenase
MSRQINRREFVRNTAILGAGLAAYGTARGLGAAETPGEKVRVGVVGLGRGLDLVKGFMALPGAEVRYICDVDDARISHAMGQIKGDGKPETVKDFRKILDDKAIDAVAIATPDHWHAPLAILACAAGKHVYVEKPVCHNPHEGEMMVAAARAHKRIMQAGTQRRSYSRVIEAIEKVKSGVIGKVHFSRGWYAADRGSIGHGKEMSPPAGLDYAMWQGPAPERAYRDNLIHYKWHWFWHWGTGEIGNNGIHALDICRWGLGVEYPLRVTSGGGRYHFKDDQQTPDTQTATYDFGDKFIVWEGRSCQPRGLEGSGFGISFEGDAGTIVIDGNGYKQYDAKGKESHKVIENAPDRPHFQNFIDCIHSGSRPNADIEEGHRSTLLCHLGNIAWRVGRTINLDPATHRIIDDKEADALWTREYRKGWEPRI